MQHAATVSPQPGDLLAFLSIASRPAVMDVGLANPLTCSAVSVAPRGTGTAAEAKDTIMWNKWGHNSGGVCRFVPVRHETYVQAGPKAFAPLNKIPEVDRKRMYLLKDIPEECDARPVHHPVAGGATRQVMAWMPLQVQQDSVSQTTCQCMPF